MKKIVKILNKYKGYILCLIIIILSIISILVQDIDRKNSLKVNNTENKSIENKIGVYITGAVKNPGVYYLSENSRIYNLLDICGGILETADISKLNLAQKLIDSDKIEVPEKKAEIEMGDEEKIEEDKKVNINTASINELKKLNGIGESTANKIIEYRNTNTFEDIQDIMNVPGIGESKFNNIKDDICVK